MLILEPELSEENLLNSDGELNTENEEKIDSDSNNNERNSNDPNALQAEEIVAIKKTVLYIFNFWF